jgi:hypothetical protein
MPKYVAPFYKGEGFAWKETNAIFHIDIVIPQIFRRLKGQTWTILVLFYPTSKGKWPQITTGKSPQTTPWYHAQPTRGQNL